MRKVEIVYGGCEVKRVFVDLRSSRCDVVVEFVLRLV